MWDIYILIVYGVPFAILGVVTLYCVPRWHVTVGNILLFIVGGLAGSIGIGQFANWVVQKTSSATGISEIGAPFYLLIVTGAELGGSGLIFLRYRLRRHSGNE